MRFTDIKMDALIQPHGGILKQLLLEKSQIDEYLSFLPHLKSWSLNPRQICDLELLLTGGFSPLNGFMTQKDYLSVVERMRLADGTLWPIPITLDVSFTFADQLSQNEKIILRDNEGTALAVLTLSDIWQPNKTKEAVDVFGSEDLDHPAVNYLFHSAGDVYLGGQIEGLSLPQYYDFCHFRHTPAQLRKLFNESGWRHIVAFQTRNPMHRAHLELTHRAACIAQANLLLHPVVGQTKPGDVDHFTRVRCYEAILDRYPKESTQLSLLPLAMRMAGPREALWHAIIRKNYGCSHFIVGRDHAGPGKNKEGKAYYDPYAAQSLMHEFQDELGVQMVPFQEMVYVENKSEYRSIEEVEQDEKVLSLSGTEFRHRLEQGMNIPEWFTYPEIIDELRRTYPPKTQQGFTIFFTGLSGAGKSTLANALMIKLLEIGGRSITLLDGDLVRRNLSSELGFSKAHRDLNVTRIGFVAHEITKNRGIAICAPIAPYSAVRQQVRERIQPVGGFVEVYVATPLTVCESRDRKGLYAKARAGMLSNFTGIDDPYEVPEVPEIVIDTSSSRPEDDVENILSKTLGYIEKS